MHMSIHTSVLALFLLALLPLPLRAADRTISTSGEAIIFVVPNEVIETFGVTTFAAQLEQAKADNDEATTRLLKAVKVLGIDDKHITTNTLQVEIQYKNNGFRGARGEIAGYMVRRAYSVKLVDTALAEKLSETALKNGANQFDGIVFQTTELRKYRDQARQMAIRAAREKAQLLAKELDCNIGKPITISEGSNGYYGNYYRGGNAMANAQQMAAGPDLPGVNGETMPLGQIAVNASVSVTFELAN